MDGQKSLGLGRRHVNRLIQCSVYPKVLDATSTELMVMKRIDIALQGGGSHGAFTWGVLDRLLELDDLEILGISGTSAGAMNALALAQGLSSGGRDQARELLVN